MPSHDQPHYSPAVLGHHCPKKLTLDSKQCVEAIRWWARKLCLEHWAIDFEFFRHHEFEYGQARCSFELSKLRATIGVLNPVDHTANDDPIDMEQVIVHEMLHVLFASWQEWTDNKEPNRSLHDRAVCEEQPIERLSWVLLSMRRSMPGLSMPESKMSWEKEVSKPPIADLLAEGGIEVGQ